MLKYAFLLVCALTPFAACATSDDDPGGQPGGDASADGKADTATTETDAGTKVDSGKKDAGKDTGPKDAAPLPDEDAGPFEDCPQTLAYAALAVSSKKACSGGCDGATECCFRNSISATADRCVPKLP